MAESGKVWLVESKRDDQDSVFGGAILIDKPRGLLLTVSHLFSSASNQVLVRNESISGWLQASVLHYSRIIDLAVLELLNHEKSKIPNSSDPIPNFDSYVHENGDEIQVLSHTSGLMYTFSNGIICYPYDGLLANNGISQLSTHDTIAKKLVRVGRRCEKNKSGKNEREKKAIAQKRRDALSRQWGISKPFRTAYDVYFMGDAYDDLHPDMPVIQIGGISLLEGSSGCPVFKRDGRVIGIISFINSGFMFAIPNEVIRFFINSMRSKKRFAAKFNPPIEEKDDGNDDDNKHKKRPARNTFQALSSNKKNKQTTGGETNTPVQLDYNKCNELAWLMQKDFPESKKNFSIPTRNPNPCPNFPSCTVVRLPPNSSRLSASSAASFLQVKRVFEEEGIDESSKASISVRAYFFCTSVDLKSLVEQNIQNFIPPTSRMTSCVVLRCSDLKPNPNGLNGNDCGYMVVFQYGSIVLFNVHDHEVIGYLKIVERHASGLLYEMDEYELLEKPTLNTWMQGGLDYIMLQHLNMDGIRTIGSVIGQSIALDYYVHQVDGIVGKLSDINRGMEKAGKFTKDQKKLFQLVRKANSNLADVILKLGILDRSDMWKQAAYAAAKDFPVLISN